MKLDPNKFGLAAAAAVAILWVLCSLIVAVLPGLSMRAGGAMMHANFSGMQPSLHFAGFLGGLVLWVIVAGIAGWLFASIYNRLL